MRRLVDRARWAIAVGLGVVGIAVLGVAVFVAPRD